MNVYMHEKEERKEKYYHKLVIRWWSDWGKHFCPI